MPKLIVVGSGIKSIAHLTEETKQIIKRADKVLYLVNEDNLKAWIKREANSAESLETIYFNFSKRIDAYHNITDYIVEEYYKVDILCVVFYGHPTLFAESALNAVKYIMAANGNAIILPAISSVDCLFSDLQIDPGDKGYFAIDATELLIYERYIDTHAHLILWQIAHLGMHDINQTNKLNILSNYLEKYYSSAHLICIYQAAILPNQPPQVNWLKLIDLPEASVCSISTLYIPPASQAKLSPKYLDLLEIDVSNYQLSAKTNTPSE